MVVKTLLSSYKDCKNVKLWIFNTDFEVRDISWSDSEITSLLNRSAEAFTWYYI
jgi:hypothetical protein